MPDSPTSHNSEPPAAVSLLKRIRNGGLDPGGLSTDERQVCVELLSQQGVPVHDIAELLKKSDRTIRRDREAIRDRNAMRPDPALVPQIVGELWMHAHSSISYFARLARDKNLPGMERIAAECSRWKTVRESVQLLQSLGYLPMVARQSVIDIFHHAESEPVPSFDGIELEVEEIIQLSQECSVQDDGRVEALMELRKEIQDAREKVHLAERLRDIKESAGEGNGDEHMH